MINSSSKLKKEIVDTLPATGQDDVIYLVKDSKGKANNVYLEYLWLDKWELIGSTEVDLSGYAKTEDLDGMQYNISVNIQAEFDKKVDKTEIVDFKRCIVLTPVEYNALSSTEKNREDTLYFIKE